MVRREVSMLTLVYDAKRFFKNTRLLHLIMALVMFGTGIASAILSHGSDGTAQVPYFFSAFISAAWHIVFIVFCQVCMYYLVEDGSRSNHAELWVRVYSISSSLFVLFNVMGVVFTVVNGMCLGGQMCYYDYNEVANRAMAILLVGEHCTSILLSVFLAKRAHVIDAELNSDISVKLNHPIQYLFHKAKHSQSRSRTSAVASDTIMSSSIGSATSLNQRSSTTGTDTPDLHHVQTDREGKVMTTIEISAIVHKRAKNRRRSKSHPNLNRQLEALSPFEIEEGHVVSIYSDSEMKQTEEKKRKKIGLIRVRKSRSNRVKAMSPGAESSADELKKQEREERLFERVTPTTANSSLHSSDLSGDIFVVGQISSPDDDAQQKILHDQKVLQEKQAALLEEQRKLFEKQQSLMSATTPSEPPPYEHWPTDPHATTYEDGSTTTKEKDLD